MFHHSFYVLIFSLVSLNLFAANSEAYWQQIDKEFKAGNYTQVKSKLSKLTNKDKSDEAKKLYYQGLISNREENYAEGAKLLFKSMKTGKSYDDLYYELGQAFYAENDLNNALKAFRSSYKKKIKAHVSLYYLAHISQILEKFDRAKTYYNQLAQEKDADINLQQISRFQYAEVIYSQAQEGDDTRAIVRDEVLPNMQAAIDLKKDSPIVNDIFKRSQELKKQHGLDPNFMINGRKAPSKSSYSYSQGLTYDNNVTYTNELPTTSATLQDSFIINTDLGASYNFIYDNRYTLKPSVSLSHTLHTNTDNSSVYQNDSYSVTPALVLDYDFKIGDSPTTWLLTSSYTHSARDWQASRTLKTSGNTMSYGLGLRFKLLSGGNTTINAKKSQLSSYNPSLDSDTLAFNLIQNYLISRYSFLLFFYQFSQTTVVDTTNNTDSHLARADYLLINKIPSLTFQFGLSANMQKLELQPVRGTELTLSGTLKATKKVNDLIKYSVSYNYSDKSSKDETYSYNKETVAFDFKLSY